MSFKHVNLSGFSLLLLVVGMAGCAILPQARPEPAGTRVAGTLTLESGQLRLRPCASGTTLAVADSGNIQQLFARVAPPARLSVFVDMRARTLAAGGLEPVEVIRLQADGKGCADQTQAGSQWVALGGVARGEPSVADGFAWQVQISPAGMQWQDAGAGSSPAPVPVISEAVPGSAISFLTLRGTAHELWVYPQGCYAQGNGDYFHRTARFTRTGETLTGCAYQGLLP